LNYHIGFAGFLFGMTLGVGTTGAGPTSAEGLKQPLFTMSLSFSYDILNHLLTDILKKLKKVMVESFQTFAYSASNGTAFDSYASRAEYAFSQPGFSEAMKTMSLDFNFMGASFSFNFGDVFDSLMFNGIPALGSDFNSGIATAGTEAEDTVNQASAQDRLFLYQHGVNGAETRETDTGAFFAINAFLSQFELADMSSEYWVGTQQNEESVNVDFGRSMLSAGKKLAETILTALGLLQKDRSNPTAMTGNTDTSYVNAVG